MAAGTAFNVDYLSDDDVRVTVAENAVNVRVGASDLRLESIAGDIHPWVHRGAAGRRPDNGTGLAAGTADFVSQPFGRVIATLKPLASRQFGGSRLRAGRATSRSSSILRKPATSCRVLQETLSDQVVRLPYITLISAA